jgi:tetratricopeptide (TPR) repeat protein
MYRMALDQTASPELKVRIQRNIGLAHIRMGQFAEAIEALEQVMEMAPGAGHGGKGGGGGVSARVVCAVGSLGDACVV